MRRNLIGDKRKLCRIVFKGRKEALSGNLRKEHVSFEVPFSFQVLAKLQSSSNATRNTKDVNSEPPDTSVYGQKFRIDKTRFVSWKIQL